MVLLQSKFFKICAKNSNDNPTDHHEEEAEARSVTKRSMYNIVLNSTRFLYQMSHTIKTERLLVDYWLID